jgi:glutathione synthase/RimK-type ligase-like ATP-grasp enzyme
MIHRGAVIRVALATCTNIPEPDPDEEILVSALERAGIEASVLPWDDAAAPFAEHDLVVLRSTWNYFEHVAEFVGWAERVAKKTRLLNPHAIVAMNATKTYLRDLDARGVDIVPTVFVDAGETRDVASILDEKRWDAIVIKPVVSAGSFRTARFDRASVKDAQAFLDGLTRDDRAAMVQQWMPAVDTTGERSLVWIDGEVTHAIRKTPRFAGGAERVSDAIAIADDERAFAERALAPFAKDLLYARVDVVRDEGGTLRIMELELIEPSLFFKQGPKRALDRFISALTRGR